MRFLPFLILFFILPFKSFAAQPLTLKECFHFALQQSETVAIQEENIRAVEGRYLQAIGTVLPQVTAYGTEFLQDDSATTGGGTSVDSTFTRFSRPEVRLNASQTLFSGFREWHSLKAVKSQKKSEKYELEAAKRALFLEVAQAFYTYLSLTEEHAAAMSIREALEKRFNVMQRRIKLGQSRISEELSVETELALAISEENVVQGALETVRETLVFLTGQPIDKVVDDIAIPSDSFEEQDWKIAINQRPEMQAARHQLDAAKATEAAEKSIRYPTLTAEANYYPYRVGFQEDIKWDALFTLSVPIFRGGTARGEIQQAKAAYRQAQLTFRETERKVLLEVKQAYYRFLTSRRRITALQGAQSKGEENYHLVEREFQRGITDNLEVLTVLNQWQDLKRQYWQAYALAKIDWLSFKIAMGEEIP